MRTQTALFRLTSALAVAPLLFATVPVVAQPAPGPPLPQAAATTADPPARVGRLARIRGTVSFHTADQTQWELATLNYPVTAGNAFWTEPGAAAEIEIGAAHIALDQTSEFDIDTLDDRTLGATLAQGEIYLRVPGMAAGSVTQIRTPRGVVAIAQPGRYEIVAGDTEHPTSVTVVDGAARVTGTAIEVDAGPHQTVQISGTDSFQATTVAAANDAFLSADSRRGAAGAGAQRRGAFAAGGGADDRRRRVGGGWRMGAEPGIWRGVVPAGGRGLGAVSPWPLGLCRTLGLDLGGRGGMGLRAVPLRPLDSGRAALGLDRRRAGGAV